MHPDFVCQKREVRLLWDASCIRVFTVNSFELCGWHCTEAHVSGAVELEARLTVTREAADGVPAPPVLADPPHSPALVNVWKREDEAAKHQVI